MLREESAWRFRERHVAVTEDEWVGCDPRRAPRRERARRRRDPRQGRLARRARDLRSDPRDGRADAACLAVAPGRARRAARGARPALADRRRLSPARLPEDLHGRHARLADRVDARRERASCITSGEELAEIVRVAAARGLAGRRPRDRRPRQSRGARRVRGDTRRLAAARAPPADRARAVPRSRRPSALRGARRRRAPSSSATRRRTATSPSGSGATGSTAPTRSARCSRAARSSRTGRTRRSRSSTRSPESPRAYCARSTIVPAGAATTP